MKKQLSAIAFIFFLPFIIYTFIGCCACIKSDIFRYSSCDLSLQNLDNSGSQPLVSSNDSIIKEAYGLRFTIDLTEGICRINEFNSSFAPVAYGLKCDCSREEIYFANDTLINIKIFTLNDFNDTISAGDEISNLFSILDDNELFTIDEYLTQLPSTLYSFENPFYIESFLMVAPSLGETHQFSVEIEFSNGKMFSAESTPVQLL